MLVLRAFNAHLAADGRANCLLRFRVYKLTNSRSCSPLLTVSHTVSIEPFGRESADKTQCRIVGNPGGLGIFSLTNKVLA